MVEKAGVAKAAGTGILATAKSVVLSPAFGIVLLAGIIGVELWKGKKDAEAMAAETVEAA